MSPHRVAPPSNDQPWPPPSLTQAEIERAWEGEKPPTPYPAYGRFMVRSTRLSYRLTLALVAVMSLCVMADRILGLGWGYRWSDLAWVVGFGLFCSILYLAGRVWYAFIGFSDRRPNKPRL